MLRKVLIANRGAIALRIIRACRSLGIRTVAIYSEADVGARFVLAADEAIPLIGHTPLESYLNIEQIINAARKTGSDALHPGYGFLSENPLLVEACDAAGIVFIGPSANAMREMGNKTRAKELARNAGVPVLGDAQIKLDANGMAAARVAAEQIGYPILVKAAAGGGGKGMRLVSTANDLQEALKAAAREAESAFGDATVFIERYVEFARHIEIQVLADNYGNIVHFGERECSCQRRHQKIVEESPSVVVNDKLRANMGKAAVELARAVKYANAGTVEFLLEKNGQFHFLEMNTRLQVEHAVTEEAYKVDLVVEQLRISSGEKILWKQENIKPRAHSIECRIYAEDPAKGFLPETGLINSLFEPGGDGVRVESGLAPGMRIGVDYDPMLAKLIVSSHDRPTAIAKMMRALSDYKISGINTNMHFLSCLVRSPAFVSGNVDTQFVDRFMTDWDAEETISPEDPFSTWQVHCSGLIGESANNSKPVRRRKQRAGANLGGLISPMPGKIIRVDIKVGDEVNEGDVVVVMEAMKMEYSIKAPATGTVQEVFCAVGDMVDSGKKLVEVK